VLQSKYRGREARPTRLLPLDLPQLVLLVFHIVDQYFLVGTHVLHDEVVIRGHGQDSSGVIAVGRSGPRLRTSLAATLS